MEAFYATRWVFAQTRRSVPTAHGAGTLSGVLDLALLGTGGMLPLPGRWLSSVLLRWAGHLVLFDCGEGTQISLRALGWGIKAIDLILVSHVHGDHVGGLPGLLLSQGNAGRTEPVRLLGPPGLKRVVDGLLVIAPHLPFVVQVDEVDQDDTFALGPIHGRVARAEHSVPCVAFRLEQSRRRRFLPERAEALGIPRQAWSRLAAGEPLAMGERVIPPDAVLGPERPGLAVALATDTRPTSALVDLARGVTLLVCEGTYGDSADQPKAVERQHMTFAEAAALAREANVGRLLLTHFSPALTDPQAYADVARQVFPNAVVGHDHLTLSLGFLAPAPEG